jgi:hypothetical protein
MSLLSQVLLDMLAELFNLGSNLETRLGASLGGVAANNRVQERESANSIGDLGVFIVQGGGRSEQRGRGAEETVIQASGDGCFVHVKS